VSGLRSLVPALWQPVLADALAAPSFDELDAFLTADAKAGDCFPPRSEIFAALECTPPASVKAVIFGQDPYPTRGNANGLAFSVNDGVKVPASLRNIFAGLSLEFGFEKPKTGNLVPWAERGVLLLNTVLTVREGAPNSHKRKGWEPFTQAVISAVNAQPGPVVFFCFGAQARDMVAKFVDAGRHAVIIAPHPSPLNGNDFVKAVEKDRPFTKANQVLEAAGRGPIDWSLGASAAR
jgi:uracil-DNA glycosylase